MSGQWSVDAAGVMGVLAQVDDEGNDLETASRKFASLQTEGASSLSVDGRTSLASAWNSFCDERTDVPRKLMWMLQHRCGQVTEATVAVLPGDAQMGDDVQAAESYAQSEWGIASKYRYNADSYPEG